MLLRYFNRTIEIRLEPCSEQYGGVVELTVLLALTMQHFLAAPHFRSAFLFHSVSSATEECMLTPDKITTRGGGYTVKMVLVYRANILYAAISDACAAAATAQREGQD